MTIGTKSLNSFVASQLLGDGHLVKNTLDISHKSSHFDYLIWKFRLASSLGLSPNAIRQWRANSTLGIQDLCGFSMWLPPSAIRSSDPIELASALDPLGLLLWWLDDGCMVVHEKKNGYSVARFGYLGTETFDELTNAKLSDTLFGLFGISTNVHIDRGGILGADTTYYRLYLNATSMRVLIDAVREYIPDVPECMLYKLNMDYRPTRLKSSVEYSQKYNF